MGQVTAEESFGVPETGMKEPTDIDHQRQETVQIITIASRSTSTSAPSINDNPFDAWLPITESREANVFSVVFHLISSGIGFQAFLLPVAFAYLGWTWGILCLSMAFAWQLYTKWLLLQLAESLPGTRISRYLHLAIIAFGPKLGKLLAMFPVMYLSGGSCVMLIITAGGYLETLYKIMCGGGAACDDKSLNGAQWFLVFACMAIAVAQLLPNLNSIAKVSVIAAVTAVGHCTFIWALSVDKGRPNDVSYSSLLHHAESDMAKFGRAFNAIGIIVLVFRGQNLVLEIQGTLPSTTTNPSSRIMWRGVTISYLLIAMSLFPLAIAGFWAYGNKIPPNGGVLKALWQVHGHDTSKYVMGTIHLLVIVHSLGSFQIFAMPVFDNLEHLYVSKKKRRCPRWVRAGLRLFFGGLAFFIAVALPFLGSLASLVGAIGFPLTYVYPCFMYNLIKKPRKNGAVWWLNLGLGCFGACLSVALVVAASWNLADKGLRANFFRPT